MLDMKPAVSPDRGPSGLRDLAQSERYPPSIELRAPALRHARATALFLLLLCVFIAVTRWLAAPKYLYYFDSANFALSLEHFDPALHQPQPPGYPLFVGLIRVIH